MVKLQRVTKNDTDLCAYVTALLEESFPLYERRDTADFWNILFSNDAVSCLIFLMENTPVGFCYMWNLVDFSYIEFIAIDTMHRSKGIFSFVFPSILTLANNHIVCEAERDSSPIAQRRLHLYIKTGFTILSDTYMQPPFRITEKPQPMYLLGYTNSSNPFPSANTIITTLYSSVYGI